jgi:type I restriction enzyme S subunit
MADHGIPWIGTIPAAWRLVTLKSLIHIKNGDWGIDPMEIGQDGTVLTCYRKADFTPLGTVERGETLRRIARKPFVRHSDILLEKSGGGDVTPVGAVAIVTAPDLAACSNFLARLRAKEKGVEPRFVWRFLSSLHASPQIWTLFKQTTGIQNIDMGAFSTVEVPCPEFSEQRRIAKWLDLQTTRIDKRRELLVEKRVLLLELQKSILHEAIAQGAIWDVETGQADGLPFGWNMLRIKDLAKLRSGNFISAEKIDPIAEFPVYGGNGMRGYASSFTHSGSFALVGRQGALCGNVNYASGKFWATEHAVVARPKRQLMTRWLGEALRCMNLNQYATASAQPGLSVEVVVNKFLPFPPLEEQRVIAAGLDQKTSRIDRQIALIDQLDDLLKQQRKALIYEAVTGKIDLSHHQPLAA